jgi:hypothetical protein
MNLINCRRVLFETLSCSQQIERIHFYSFLYFIELMNRRSDRYKKYLRFHLNIFTFEMNFCFQQPAFKKFDILCYVSMKRDFKIYSVSKVFENLDLFFQFNLFRKMFALLWFCWRFLIIKFYVFFICKIIPSHVWMILNATSFYSSLKCQYLKLI